MTRWMVAAKYMLQDGYGVEDISVIFGIDVAEVRRLVSAMRGSGMLAKMFKKNGRGI